MHVNYNLDEAHQDLVNVLDKYMINDINFTSYKSLFTRLSYDNQERLLKFFTTTMRKLDIINVDKIVTLEYIESHIELHDLFIIVCNYFSA